MTNSFNVGDLARLAQTVIDRTNKGQEFMLEDVHNITRAAYEKYPEDPVINQVCFVIEKMASKASSGAIISQADISKIFNEFSRLGSTDNFRSSLGFLLKDDKKQATTASEEFIRHNRLDAVGKEIDTSDMVDSNLVGAISAAFGGSIDEIKAFDQNIAKHGVGLVSAELRALGFDNTTVEIMGGNPSNIVYAAHFDTRKGRVTVAMPTEVKDGRILFPSTFVADDHLEELTSTKLSYFVDSKVEQGNFSVPSTKSVLSAVSIINGHVKKASDDYMSNITGGMENNKEVELSIPNLFVDRKYEDPKPDIDTSQNVKMPDVLAHLSRDFEDDVLEAASSFGLNSVSDGKQLVARELRAAGFKNAQVKFGSESADSVVYLAKINTPKGPVEIEVPVEMKSIGSKHVPLSPSYFAYDGLIEDFTPAKLQRFAIKLPVPSTTNTQFSSSFAYMTLSELKDEIVNAVSANDYVTCEIVLDEIEAKFSEEDFKNAVADFHHVVMHKAHLSEREQFKCAKMIPAGKGSVYARCGHFGVPMHKVVTDEHGNCRLKTAVEREKLNPADEGGAAISSAKVFMA
jgi:hypothetical protein